ncbi:hypothetical protein AC629_42955 [Bradyrhizobium sp. NAS80.1]|nr:hypothetical protein AC629_42955 [Bradyrhizobium sp. NAS80.1]
MASCIPNKHNAWKRWIIDPVILIGVRTKWADRRATKYRFRMRQTFQSIGLQQPGLSIWTCEFLSIRKLVAYIEANQVLPLRKDEIMQPILSSDRLNVTRPIWNVCDQHPAQKIVRFIGLQRKSQLFPQD